MHADSPCTRPPARAVMLVQRGRIYPACRAVLQDWLERFAGRDDVTFAVEGCTGWRFVVEELQAAGITALLAEPAQTAHRSGRLAIASSLRSGSHPSGRSVRLTSPRVLDASLRGQSASALL
jgi:transposase